MQVQIQELIDVYKRQGLKGEELNEMDLSELIENEIVDLNDDGMRWEPGE